MERMEIVAGSEEGSGVDLLEERQEERIANAT